MTTKKNVSTSILGAIFVESKEHTAILRKFTHILPKLLLIVHGFSLNQNVCGCGCTPASKTSAFNVFR